jgi:hypothetical protein
MRDSIIHTKEHKMFFEVILEGFLNGGSEGNNGLKLPDLYVGFLLCIAINIEG